MTTTTTTASTSSRFGLPKRLDADRVGVAASVLCAIHCGVAPFLLLALPAFGKIWAHPASHALVAIFIVPLAIFSIWKGYQRHRRRWVVWVAGIGISCVLVGAALPALTKESAPLVPEESVESSPVVASDCEGCADEGCEDEGCADEGCEEEGCEEEGCAASETSEAAAASGPAATVGCVDNCCPSAQISESGEITIHVPPAAIVTTLGGVFLILAHAGNLKGCRQCCSPTAA